MFAQSLQALGWTDLHPDGGCRRSQVSRNGLGIRMVGINQQSDARNGGDELVQQAQLLCREIRDEEVHPGRIAARPGKARNESELHRIISGAEYDGNGRGRSLCREGRRGGKCNDHGNLIAHQFRRHRWESIILTLDPTVLDRHVAALDGAAVG